MKFLYFSIKYRYSDILLKKTFSSFITVCFAAIIYTCYCAGMFFVTSASLYGTSASRYHLNLRRSTELAETVPISAYSEA